MKQQKYAAIILLLIVFLIPGYVTLQEQEPVDHPRPIELQDILNWKNIQATELSNDGKWFAYSLGVNEGDTEVIIRETLGSKEFKFPGGKTPGPIKFSNDSRWLAFAITPNTRESQKAEKSKKKLHNKVALVNLATGDKIEFEKVKRFAFSGEQGGWIALHKYPPNGQTKEEDKWRGSDLILHELATSKQFNFGNVADFAFDKKGRWLAWLIDAQDNSGNGVLLRVMDSGLILSLDSDSTEYESLNWTENGDAFAVLKGKKDKNFEDKLYSFVAFKNLDAKTPFKVSYDPQNDKDFPDKMTISPNQSPLWTDDLTGIILGIHEAKRKEDTEEPKKADSAEKENPENDTADPDTTKKEAKQKAKNKEDLKLPDVVIWHWNDKRLQPMQQVQQSVDKNFSYLCLYQVNSKKFIRLADDDVKQVKPAPKHRWAIGYDDSKYELMGNLIGQQYKDIYTINLQTGQRKLALEQNRWDFAASPTGTHFLYYDDGNFYSYEMATDRKINITETVPTSFIDNENDVNVEKPPIRPFGWTKDGKFVVLYDNWDAWLVRADGKMAQNLTVSGKKDGVRYQRRFVLDPEEKGIDFSASVYFSVYGEWSKKAGIARIDRGKPGARTLLWDDAVFSRLLKAKDADVFLFTRENFETYPDYFVSDASLQNGNRLTEANPQQKNYPWSSGVRLINYVSDKGDSLQAALFLPSDYKSGERYPTIVYIYEKLSQNLNRYFAPSARGFNKSVYNSHGYAVLMPDITYKINDPGMSAVWCVLPAIQAAIESGVVDKDRIAIHGHSWGGYQTAFLITQTDLFKAAIAGAPLTNMISMYSSVYWNTGSANQPIFESSQGRFSGGYWENIEAYTRNSPVFHASNVKTPLLLLHNDKDGAVDWNQGIEYFNTLRRLEKPVVMLQYKGENHGLRNPENQKDYTIRMKQFFDYHLKRAPAPGWLEEGIPYLKLKEHLEEVAKVIEKKEQPKKNN